MASAFPLVIFIGRYAKLRDKRAIPILPSANDHSRFVIFKEVRAVIDEYFEGFCEHSKKFSVANGEASQVFRGHYRGVAHYSVFLHAQHAPINLDREKSMVRLRPDEMLNFIERFDLYTCPGKKATEKDSTHPTSRMSLANEPNLIIFGNMEEELPLEILAAADLAKQTTRKTPKTTQMTAANDHFRPACGPSARRSFRVSVNLVFDMSIDWTELDKYTHLHTSLVYTGDSTEKQSGSLSLTTTVHVLRNSRQSGARDLPIPKLLNDFTIANENAKLGNLMESLSI
ncbi:hypothetical protein CLF_106814 [Clonorchis sinensis]|uniref:Uncharacterized protein n=1 Tax=Clonorchis sinensis TaxID=79923 RepID=G7YFR8_CLOSI|nr:hypothetical protein CLF_106814 [Clonorchis sinensis]